LLETSPVTVASPLLTVMLTGSFLSAASLKSCALRESAIAVSSGFRLHPTEDSRTHINRIAKLRHCFMDLPSYFRVWIEWLPVSPAQEAQEIVWQVLSGV
jgi:hypothetical protein